MGSPGREPLGDAYEGGWGRRRARSLPVSRVACIVLADGIGKPRRGRGPVETSRDKNRGLVSFAICLCKLQRRAAGLRATVGGNTHVPTRLLVASALVRTVAPHRHYTRPPARGTHAVPSSSQPRSLPSLILQSYLAQLLGCVAAGSADAHQPYSHFTPSSASASDPSRSLGQPQPPASAEAKRPWTPLRPCASSTGLPPPPKHSRG